MKILVANIGSTSLKWRLFDFSNGAERLLHKGGFERVADYSKAIDDCLAQLREAGAIANERDLAGVGFKTVLAKNLTGCVRLDERALGAMAAFNGLAPAHNPSYITGIRLFGKRMPGIPLVGLFETAFYQFAPEAMSCHACGTASASNAGDFMAPVTSSSPNVRRNYSSATISPNASATFTSTAARLQRRRRRSA